MASRGRCPPRRRLRSPSRAGTGLSEFFLTEAHAVRERPLVCGRRPRRVAPRPGATPLVFETVAPRATSPRMAGLQPPPRRSRARRRNRSRETRYSESREKSATGRRGRTAESAKRAKFAESRVCASARKNRTTKETKRSFPFSSPRRHPVTTPHPPLPPPGHLPLRAHVLQRAFQRHPSELEVALRRVSVVRVLVEEK